MSSETTCQQSKPSAAPVGRKYNRWTREQERFLFAQPEIKTHLRNKTASGAILGQLLIQRSVRLLNDKDWKAITNKIHNMNNLEKTRLQRQENERSM